MLQDTRSVDKKSIVFLYANSEHPVNKSKKTILFIITSKNKIGINLIDEFWDLLPWSKFASVPLTPNFYTEIQMHGVMMLEGGVFDKCLSHEGRILRNGISDL